MMLRVLLAALCLAGGDAHPCDTEVSVACPDRPADEMARCLKNPEEHETPTVLSSECTDFVALNVACHGDIESNCDDGHFTDETVKCLTEETEDDRLAPQCKSVLSWAVPGRAEEEEEWEQPDDTATDEIGMSEKDHREKQEWQDKRRAARQDSIERLKMKEADSKKEEERVALETYKRENPEAYAEMLKQQEEDKRQAAEFKRRERMIAAAVERKRRVELGLSEDDEVPADGEKPEKKKTKKSKEADPVPNKPPLKSNFWGSVGALVVVAICIGGAFFGIRKAGGPSKTNSARKAAMKAKKGH